MERTDECVAFVASTAIARASFELKLPSPHGMILSYRVMSRRCSMSSVA